MLADTHHSMGMGGGDGELTGASMLMGMGRGGNPGTVEVGVVSLVGILRDPVLGLSLRLPKVVLCSRGIV